jgi:hypothetical protein
MIDNKNLESYDDIADDEINVALTERAKKDPRY